MTDPTPPDSTALRLERTFDAPAQAVFDAWISGEALRRWWPAGPDWETPVAEVDPRVGGSLRLVMRNPEGEEFGGSGEYLEIDRPHRLVFTWTWDGQEGRESRQLIEVEFSDQDDGTTSLVLTNRGLPDEQSKRAHRDGWQASFDNLDRVLAAYEATASNRRGKVLRESQVAARIPARDLARARRFYTEMLGLEPSEERPGGLLYRCGSGEFALFESSGVSSGAFTQMAWQVEDIEAAVETLRERGVVFERYEVPGLTTVDGIAEVEGNYPSKGTGERAAWFRDSEGNLLAIGEAVP